MTRSMRRTVGWGTLLALVGGTAIARAQDRPGPGPMDIVVTAGEAVIKVAPDQAFVTLSVESRSKMPREAQQQNAETMTSIQQKLRGAGVPSEAMRTIAIELSPEFDYVSGRQQMRGYVARNSIEVRVDTLESLGDVIGAAVGTGATNVSGVRFDVKRRDELEREALRQAVAQARSRAEAAAAGAGRTVDRVMRIEDSGAMPAPPPRPMMMAAARAAEMAPAPPPPVAPGELEITARVTLTAVLR